MSSFFDEKRIHSAIFDEKRIPSSLVQTQAIMPVTKLLDHANKMFSIKSSAGSNSAVELGLACNTLGKLVENTQSILDKPESSKHNDQEFSPSMSL